MPAGFEFATAGRIVFGSGAAAQAGAIAATLGRRALVVHGRTAARATALVDRLAAAGLEHARFEVAGEPDTAMVTAGAAAARSADADLVIGIGGGSVLDAAKAIAVLATNPAPVLEYLEVVGHGHSLGTPGLPVIAMPTTAGTGSEVTRNAVITSPEHRVKVSLRSPFMMPRVALVDPRLGLELPPALTATTGLDALTQLIEAYVSSRATPMTDALTSAGIGRAARALPRAVRDGHDLGAREDMALAALWSGMALANAGLGAVHGFAGPIGGMFDAPHGATCAALLPHVFRTNARALDERGDAPARARFTNVARWVTNREDADGPDGADWLDALIRDLAIPSLRTYGVTPSHVPELVENSRRASSMKGNPIVLTPEELAGTLTAAI